MRSARNDDDEYDDHDDHDTDPLANRERIDLTALHTTVLGFSEQHGVTRAGEVATALSLLAVIEAVCLDLEAAGFIEPAPRH